MRRHFKLLVIIILGRPGSGKGTQAKLLVKKFDLEYFGGGDALRRRQKVKDFTGEKLTKVMKRGELAPSFIVSKLWIDALEKFKQKEKFKGFVSDGVPRKTIQAKLLSEGLDWYQWGKRVKVLLIDISKKESLKRLTKRRICKHCKRLLPWLDKFKKLKRCDKCGGPLFTRRDDTPQAIKKRLEEFNKEVVPTLNYYKKQGKLIRINGEQSIENVFKDILKAIK